MKNMLNAIILRKNRFRVIKDYGNPSKIRVQQKIETCNICSKTAELPFAHLKQNMHLTEFTTIGHNLKRIYNEINRKK